MQFFKNLLSWVLCCTKQLYHAHVLGWLNYLAANLLFLGLLPWHQQNYCYILLCWGLRLCFELTAFTSNQGRLQMDTQPPEMPQKTRQRFELLLQFVVTQDYATAEFPGQACFQTAKLSHVYSCPGHVSTSPALSALFLGSATNTPLPKTATTLIWAEHNICSPLIFFTDKLRAIVLWWSPTQYDKVITALSPLSPMQPNFLVRLFCITLHSCNSSFLISISVIS